MAANDLETKESETVMKSSVVVAEEEKTVYYFTFSNKIKKSQPPPGPDASIDWKIKLVEGKIAAASGKEKINWGSQSISVLSEDSQLKEKLSTQQVEDILVCDGFAFVSDKKYILLLLLNSQRL